MDTIYIESAASYAGPMPKKGSGEDAVFQAYKAELGPKAAYSLVERKDCTQLTGYVYQNPKEDAQSGCILNGQTNADKLIACIEKIKEIKKTGNVYVINANSAHHWTYVLSKNAFTASATKKKKVVVNFDNHEDYGKTEAAANPTGGTMIQCGGWGAFHVAYWGNQDGGVEYVMMGNGKSQISKNSFGVYSIDVKGGKLVYKPFKDEKEAKEHLGAYKKEDHEVYFTVDRDFMKGNGTKYGDAGCLYDNGSGNRVVKECIAILKSNSISIIGADMIGFPTFDDKKGFKVDLNLFNVAAKDVKTFVDLLK